MSIMLKNILINKLIIYLLLVIVPFGQSNSYSYSYSNTISNVQTSSTKFMTSTQLSNSNIHSSISYSYIFSSSNFRQPTRKPTQIPTRRPSYKPVNPIIEPMLSFETDLYLDGILTNNFENMDKSILIKSVAKVLNLNETNISWLRNEIQPINNNIRLNSIKVKIVLQLNITFIGGYISYLKTPTLLFNLLTTTLDLGISSNQLNSYISALALLYNIINMKTATVMSAEYNNMKLTGITISFNITNFPSINPTLIPTLEPTLKPTLRSSVKPSIINDTLSPTLYPITLIPTTNKPILSPTIYPTLEPTLIPTFIIILFNQTISPTTKPVVINTTLYPTYCPSLYPSIGPTNGLKINSTKNSYDSNESNKSIIYFIAIPFIIFAIITIIYYASKEYRRKIMKLKPIHTDIESLKNINPEPSIYKSNKVLNDDNNNEISST